MTQMLELWGKRKRIRGKKMRRSQREGRGNCLRSRGGYGKKRKGLKVHKACAAQGVRPRARGCILIVSEI